MVSILLTANVQRDNFSILRDRQTSLITNSARFILSVNLKSQNSSLGVIKEMPYYFCFYIMQPPLCLGQYFLCQTTAQSLQHNRLSFCMCHFHRHQCPGNRQQKIEQFEVHREKQKMKNFPQVPGLYFIFLFCNQVGIGRAINHFPYRASDQTQVLVLRFLPGRRRCL